MDNGRSMVTWGMDYRVEFSSFGWLLGQSMMKMMTDFENMPVRSSFLHGIEGDLVDGGEGTLEPYAYDKAVMTKPWGRSEKEISFQWKI